MKEVPGFDLIVCLQPTSPLRRSSDIDDAIEVCIKRKAPSCVSIAVSEQSPYWMFNLNENEEIRSLMQIDSQIVRRQDLPPVYSLNGAIYVAKIDWLFEKKSFITNETIGFIMPLERSIDIDTELDLKIASFIIEKNRHD
jgi:N-acylneuraminate cytidylyltransferase